MKKMGEIIDMGEKFRKPPDNLIALKPWEFRKADWETAHFVQMLKSQSIELERHREKTYRTGHKAAWSLPSHFSLKGGTAYTIRAMYACREDESRMREVYYLAGLMDCMINQVNPLLRTDLLRAMYKKVFAMKKALNVHWYGPLDQVLLPIDPLLSSGFEYRSSLGSAQTMKALYETIRKRTDEMFEAISVGYVFYCPRTGG